MPVRSESTYCSSMAGFHLREPMSARLPKLKRLCKISPMVEKDHATAAGQVEADCAGLDRHEDDRAIRILLDSTRRLRACSRVHLARIYSVRERR